MIPSGVVYLPLDKQYWTFLICANQYDPGCCVPFDELAIWYGDVISPLKVWQSCEAPFHVVFTRDIIKVPCV